MIFIVQGLWATLESIISMFVRIRAYIRNYYILCKLQGTWPKGSLSVISIKSGSLIQVTAVIGIHLFGPRA